jgi:hypothetical protein
MTTPATSSTWTGKPDGLDSLFGTIDCDLVCTIGATGAPTIVHGTDLFVITRTAAGVYTIGFNAGPFATSPANAVLQVTGTIIPATATGGLDVFLTTDNSTSSSTPGIGISCYARGGVTATEITSGNTLCVHIRVKTF